MRHPEDYIMEMTQSGEHFRGRKPTLPSSLQVRRVLVREGLCD